MAAKSFSSKKIILCFLFISLIFLSNVFGVEEYELVNKVCNEQDDVDFCLNVLKSDVSSKFATKVKVLANISVNVTRSNSTGTLSLFKGVEYGPPGLLKSFQECTPLYDDTVFLLNVFFKEKDCFKTVLDILFAEDDVKRCQGIANGNGAHDSIITPANDGTLKFLSLSEYLAKLMCMY
ncbi:invertase inhibitor [Tanacetum coccineum]